MRKICILTHFQFCHEKTVFLCFFVFLLSLFCTLLFESSPVSAFSYYQDRPTGIGLQRSFINSSGDVILNQSFATLNSYPQNLLSQDPLNYLLGFRFNAIDIRNNGYKTYNTVYFDAVIYANTAALYAPAYNTFDMSIRLLANNTFQHGTCEVSEVQSNYIRYHCVAAATANFKPDYLYVTFGNYDYQQGQAYWGQAISQILISYVGWGFDAQDDPNTAYLQQIANQNQTIINQNQQIINGQQQIDDSVNHPDYIDEERQELEDTQDDAQDAADDSAADAENQGQTLLQAFSSFVSAITNASPSNCVIDADLGHMDLGDIDLCELDPPPIFQTIASILLIGFCVPLSLATANKVISLFRSFQT